MSDDRFNSDPVDTLRQGATLREYSFVSGAPGVGGFVARLREAWNSVATKWQVRPLMEQQSDFNRALADWLAGNAGAAELDKRLIEQDHAHVGIAREAALVAARSERLRAGIHDADRRDHPGERRLRIAYFSPMPPSRSGIADYSAELLPYLAELADVTVFVDDPAAVTAVDLPLMATADYGRHRYLFDLPLYQMGNSDQHEIIYEQMTRYPGVVVLHDYFLHHFVRHHTAGRGDWVSYGREMAYSLGSDGRRLARAVRAGQAAAPLFDVPLNRRVIDSALGLIVHSEFAASRARRERPGIPLTRIPALIKIRPGQSLRATLRIPDEAVLFGSFGQITVEKQVDPALRAFHELRDGFPAAYYLLVGEALPDVNVPSLVAELGLSDFVHHTGFVAELDRFVDWLYTADVVVNLRLPTAGETSAVALRAMAAARPLIVLDHGWYSELPDDAALKVPPGDGVALRAAMEQLAASPELRRSMGASGQEYVRRNCLPPHVARAYVDFLHAVLEPVGTVHV